MADDPRYPIGKFARPEKVSDDDRNRFIADIAALPAAVRNAVQGLNEAQLDTPYRDGGWTLRQTVHHIADSHMNAFVRVKLTLTENEPVIKPYEQKLWAETAEARTGPVEVSLRIIEGIHERWVGLMKSLPPEAFERMYRHPESGLWSLNVLTALYAWHGRHHTAHITSLRKRMGW